jgi:hypothetical protein
MTRSRYQTPLRIARSVLALALAQHVGCAVVDRTPRAIVQPVGDERAPRERLPTPTGGERAAASGTVTQGERPVARTAEAQPMATTVPDPVAGPFADEVVADDAPLPAIPAAPTAAPSLEPRIAALQRTAGRATECWTARGERMVHLANPRCPRWFEELAAGGQAAAHALGRQLLEGARFHRDVTQQMLSVLRRTDNMVGAQYLLSAMGSSLERDARAPSTAESTANHPYDDAAGREHRRRATWIDVFEFMTGYPVRISAPWATTDQGQAREVRAAMIRALRFWELSSGDPARMRALANERVRRWLEGDTPRALHAAQVELQREGGDRGVALAVLRRIEREGESSEARGYARFLIANADAPRGSRSRAMD